MSGTATPTRVVNSAEHLQLLRSLAQELERALQSIADNDIAELEDSIAGQQSLAEQLASLAHHRGALALQPSHAESNAVDPDFAPQIRAAAEQVQTLNLRYSILLQHASRTVALMASMFRSFQGQIQEDSGARLHHATWSCQG
jgi:flagellar biosynthesis/type III secretory pathway chaperone